MKNTRVILYAGGSYGTYLEWVLYTLTNSHAVLKDPGRANGNSHGYRGNELSGMSAWRKYLASDRNLAMVRFHPKTSKQESLIANVQEIASQAGKIIHIYPTQKTYLLTVHNQMTKIWDDLWTGPLAYIDPQDIYQGWNVDSRVPLDQLPIWIQREYFSYNLFKSYDDQIEWYLPDHVPDQNNYRYVFVDDLLNDFTRTIRHIQDFFQIEFVRAIDDILPIHEKNLGRQVYMNQQSLAEKIIANTISQVDFDWNPQDLTVFTEAWIQSQLREKGLEVQCNGLDKWPTNSLQLAKLLYPR
jgi:hypothetical protein